LIDCALDLAVQGEVKSADGKAVLAVDFGAQYAAVRCTVRITAMGAPLQPPAQQLGDQSAPPMVFFEYLGDPFFNSSG